MCHNLKGHSKLESKSEVTIEVEGTSTSKVATGDIRGLLGIPRRPLQTLRPQRSAGIACTAYGLFYAGGWGATADVVKNSPMAANRTTASQIKLLGGCIHSLCPPTIGDSRTDHRRGQISNIHP